MCRREVDGPFFGWAEPPPFPPSSVVAFPKVIGCVERRYRSGVEIVLSVNEESVRNSSQDSCQAHGGKEVNLSSPPPPGYRKKTLAEKKRGAHK